MECQQQPTAHALRIPSCQLSISTIASSQRNTMTPQQASPVRSTLLHSSPARNHVAASYRTASSSTISPSSTGAPTPVTAPPTSAHVPGLGEDCFLDLMGMPTPPPSVRARAGRVGYSDGRTASSAPPQGVAELVALSPRSRLDGRWEPIEPFSEDRSSLELDHAHILCLQQLAEGTLSVDGGPALRGSHSFDSVLTARVDPQSPDLEHTPTAITPPGAIHSPTLEITPPTKNSFIASYHALVFDVLQTFDGSALSSPSNRTSPVPFENGDAVNPLPPDDPRFILWSTPTPPVVPTGPPRQSAFINVQPPTPTQGPVRRNLLACTLERWIAQLTSSLDYDILLDTLISYRPFLPPAALARLLIMRFMWTLQQPPADYHPTEIKRQEVVRKIVRLRTMLVMRCWLQVFFRVDFVHNKEA
ncbi:hypothetical protein DACRYDRAFT_120076, partial [Dacryopinax primogenitus]